MSAPHPYCAEHDQPLEWCAHHVLATGDPAGVPERPEVFGEIAANPALMRPERTDLAAHARGMFTACGIMVRALGHAIRSGDLGADDARGLYHEALQPLADAYNAGEPWPA